MSLDQFPYRVISDRQTALELLETSALIRRRFEELTAHLVSMGRAVSSADRFRDQLPEGLLKAWAFSEFGWSSSVTEGFAAAVFNFERQGSFNPHAAIDLACVLSMTVNATFMRELIKARDLVKSYREVIKGDRSFAGLRIPRCRRGSLGRRGRVRRASTGRLKPLEESEE